ncbi:MAG: cytochrome c biogenesis protein CcdA [Candidatus Babeliales bacterium]
MGTYQLLFFAFFSGILASFTPCIYPMIPITIGILQSQASSSLLRNFLLSLFYVLGIASIYAVLGYIVATTSIIFGQWLANPWIVAGVILLFLYLAFSMFGFYEIYMPAFMLKSKNINVRGSLFYSFIFGLVSGTIASPCLTPALAVILGFVAKTANPILGFLALFLFALGMGLLLIVIGTFSTTIFLLPRAGLWMLEVKKFFGFVLLGVCIYFLQPFISLQAMLKFYSILLLVASLFYFSTNKGNKIKIFLGIFLFILSILLLFQIMGV